MTPWPDALVGRALWRAPLARTGAVPVAARRICPLGLGGVWVGPWIPAHRTADRVAHLRAESRPAGPARCIKLFEGGNALKPSTRTWSVIWGVARNESAVSVRTAALWVAPALWAAVLVAQMQGTDLSTGLANATGSSFFAGLLAAALAVSLPGRTHAARAEDILESQPAAGTVAAGRVLAALWASAALVLIAPAVGFLYAFLRGVSVAGSTGPLGIYLAVVLPAAWVGAMLGMLAGTVLRDMRLAALALFLGGAAAFAGGALNAVLTPLGAWDIVGDASSASAVPWPLRPLLPWHVLAMTATAALGAVAAAGLLRRRTLGMALLALGGAAGVVAGAAGYAAVLSGFSVGHAGQYAEATAPWRVQGMTVTLRVGRASVATDSMVLSNAGPVALQSVALHLPVGLAATAARVTGGQTLSPGPVLRLPAAVPPGGSVDLTVTYGGRWTAFRTRQDNSLARAAGPGHLVLQANPGGAFGWLPAPAKPASFPLSLRLTGAVPAPTFCNLAAVAPETWQGTHDSATCVGEAGLQLVRAGSVEIWSPHGRPSLTTAAQTLNREVAAVAACLDVPGVAVGAVATPGTSEGWNNNFSLARYGDSAVIAPVPAPLQLQVDFLSWTDATGLLWGQTAESPFAADPFLSFDLQQLVPPEAARRAGLPPPIVFVPSSSPAQGGSPGAAAVARALGPTSPNALSPQAGCALLANLRHLNAQGQLTDAAVSAAIARVQGSPG